MILAAEGISKSYSDKKILDEVSLYIDKGDKIGVVGKNGAGKSTLLRILADKERRDGGVVTLFGGTRIGYLPQSPVFDEKKTVLEQVLAGVGADEYEAKAVLTRLMLTDFDADVRTLSGGQKKRVAIARALVTPCELLILDEPTNHIDNEMVAWLEEYLQKYTGAMLMVTHDRYFLDRISNRIVEVSDGKLYQYQSNYSKYIELKHEREQMEEGSRRKLKSFLKRELEWMHQGPKARSSKSRFRVEQFERLSAQQGGDGGAELAMGAAASRLGKKIVDIEGVHKRYGDKYLLRDFSYTVLRDDRIGIIGKNGCGKSTLLKMIVGIVDPDEGSVDVGGTVRIGYFSQECEDMDETARVIDYIKESGDEVETPDGKISATRMLERFLFPTEVQWNVIGKLSGGERRRLYLLKIIMQKPNILLLDEPTNDLDIETLMVLEDYLDGFLGAVVAVSHDRYFLDRVADNIFAFEGDNVSQYTGGYTDYIAKREDQLLAVRTEKPKVQRADRQRQLKFTFNEQREFETIDDVLEELSGRIEQTEQEIEQSSSDFERLQELLAKKELLLHEREQKEERWLYLNEIHENLTNTNQ